jgi:hypothetical protein
MPTVRGKEFLYTRAGREAAKNYAKGTRKKPVRRPRLAKKPPTRSPRY